MGTTETLGIMSAMPGVDRLERALYGVLAFGFMVYTFIGTNPLGAATLSSRAEGSPLDRLVILGMAGLAVIVLALNRNAVPAMLARGTGVWAIVAIALASILWSQYPGLTLRRSVLFFCITLISAGIAAGTRDLRSLHTAFCYAISAVILINLVIVFAMPSVGVDELGAQGIYTQKNVAGMVAMTGVLAAATWMGSGNSRDRVIGLIMVAIAMLFLVLTKSKTSLGLALGMLAILGAFVVAGKGGPAVVLVAILAMLFGAVMAIVGLAALDFDPLQIATVLVGDATFTGRDALWAFTYRSAMEYPLLGHGYGAFWDVGPGGDPLLRIEPGVWLGDIEPGLINQAHNGYLELWLQLGLPAVLLAVVTVIMAAMKGALSAMLTPASGGERAALVFMTSMLVLYLIHNLTEASLFIRGIILCNVTLPIMFLLARFPDFPEPTRSRRGKPWQ